MRFFSLALVSVLYGALWVPAASARPAAGLTTNNSLVIFDTDTPATLVKGPTPIAGLTAGDTLVDIDIRPANGLLYGLGKAADGTGRIYTLNPSLGTATLVSTLGADPTEVTAPYTALNGTEFGIDFAPVADRLRVVSDAGQNLRINVANGIATTDTDLNPGTPVVTANAYTNSFAGATSTTLYGIDFANQSLVTQNPPNTGTINEVGGQRGLPTGSTTLSGFDIASVNGANFGFATLTPSATPTASTLCSIDLDDGTFTAIDTVGGGLALRGLALTPGLSETPSLVVTTASDVTNPFDGETTLREAIEFANSDPDPSDILFSPLFDTAQTITLNGELSITSDIVIQTRNLPDEGLPSIFEQLLTLDGNNSNRIFNISVDGTLFAPGLTLRNGNAVDGDGGAIYNAGRMQLTFCTLADNSAGNDGGAIFNEGELIIAACSFVNNDATGDGGAVASFSIDAPSTPFGNAVFIISTFAGNTAGGNGGAVFNGQGLLGILSCTIAGNTAPAGKGGGLFQAEGAGTATNVLSSLIVGNTGGDVDVASDNTSFISGGNNLVGSGSGAADFSEETDTTRATLASSGIATQNGAPLLADNGGPTRTIALLPTSPAIDAGASLIDFDQRGFESPSGKAPDIGAYEFVSPIPRVLSVFPQGAVDTVGAEQTFSLVVRDGDGASDIKEMWLLVNTSLDWSGGATLVFFPESGLLYLRQGDSFLPPIKIGDEAGPSDVLDNGALRIVGSDVSTVVSSDGTSLSLTIDATVRNGLVGQNRLFARVQDKADQVDAASLPGTFGFVDFGSYTVKPQFQSDVNRIPTLSALSPKAAFTTIPTTGVKLQSFVFYAKDEDGIGDLDSLWFSAGKARDGANGATFVFLPRTRRLYLRSDDGQSFLGGGRIGSAGIIENSQVRVDLSQVQYLIYGDGQSVGLRLNLQPKVGLLGQNNIWLRVQDNAGATSTGGDSLGFVQSGTWNVGRQSSTINGVAPSAPGS